MYRPKEISPNFRKDKFHIERMMCPTCGLIFDFEPEFGPDELGWPSYDPPLDRVNFWVDEYGEFHEEDKEHKPCCPRCGTYFEENSLLPIVIFPSTKISDLMYLIEQGEGLIIEFKGTFPSCAHDLQKEIAAFATTQGGRIFLGVDDEGKILGLNDIQSPREKDNFQKRVRGLIGGISPKPEVYTNFYSDGQLNIAVISVPKGNRPLYSIDGQYYIRDMDSSRRATPEEIERLINKVKSWIIKFAGDSASHQGKQREKSNLVTSKESSGSNPPTRH